MILYQVKISIKKSIEKKWIKWMKDIHIPDVLNTKYFLNARLLRVLSPDSDDTESVYLVEYETDSIKKYENYITYEAQRLQSQHSEKFRDYFSASRLLAEAILSK